MTDFFHSGKNFLIVLPSEYEEAAIAGNTLKKLFDALKKAHLTVIATGIRATALSDMKRSEIIRLDDVDINKLFLPRKNVLQRLHARSYDVAIDMNLDFVLHAAYICRESRAPIRVGVMHQNGERFFNVLLNLNRAAPSHVVYEKFVQQLEMF